MATTQSAITNKVPESSSKTQSSSPKITDSTSATTSNQSNPISSTSCNQNDNINIDKQLVEDEAYFFCIVKHSGSEYKIENLMQDHTVGYLKEQIYELTNVMPLRQKLFGLKPKEGDVLQLGDDVQLDCTNFTPGMKIMMMGSQEKEIEGIKEAPKDRTYQFEDDFDIGDDDELDLDARIPFEPEYLKKVARRVEKYKINMLNYPRPNKKLLVLDIDYTLFDHRSIAQSAMDLMRPFLHEFLTLAYENYDIVIWSATSMRFIIAKMQELRIANNPNYKILFYLDSGAMISIKSQRYNKILAVKPLSVIWGKFSEYYSPKNTIMFDDIRRNFLMNPQNGLKIKSFREAHKNRATDKELLQLTVYLKMIAPLDDLSNLDHKNWKAYCNIDSGKRHKSSR